jgi:hypothetical protein
MASYEFVAFRSVDIDEAPTVGTTIPRPGGTTWRVIRIEEATDLVWTGEPTEPHLRLICAIE